MRHQPSPERWNPAPTRRGSRALGLSPTCRSFVGSNGEAAVGETAELAVGWLGWWGGSARCGRPAPGPSRPRPTPARVPPGRGRTRTTSRTLSMHCRSVDSSQVSTWYGSSPQAARSANTRPGPAPPCHNSPTRTVPAVPRQSAPRIQASGSDPADCRRINDSGHKSLI